MEPPPKVHAGSATHRQDLSGVPARSVLLGARQADLEETAELVSLQLSGTIRAGQLLRRTQVSSQSYRRLNADSGEMDAARRAGLPSAQSTLTERPSASMRSNRAAARATTASCATTAGGGSAPSDDDETSAR